jgi:hypothetical protein
MLNQPNIVYQPNTYNRLFNDKAFISQLVLAIKYIMGRQLYRTEKLYIINRLKNIDPTKFAEQMVKTPCRDANADIDIHEMLKSEIGLSAEENVSDIGIERDFTMEITSNFANQVEVTSLLGNRTLTDLQRLINPALVKKTFSILLDTRYRILDTDGTTSFQWNFINNEITSQGSVNAIGNIRDIVSFRIFPVRMPYLSVADNEYQRISIFVQEFTAQSFIGQENRRFHFIFESDIEDRWINLKPENYNDGFFRFRSPIVRLETLTLSFGAPLEPIVFDTDRLLASVTLYSTTTRFVTVSDHNLETGDRIYVSNFTTLNPNTDTVFVSSINRSIGHIATIVDATTLTINVNSSSIRVVGAGTISVTNSSPIVVGLGTSFSSVLNINDYVEISGTVYKVLSLQSNLQLTLSENYQGATAGGLTFYRNNTISSLRPILYFGSKRMFIPFEIEYYESEST